MNTYKLSHLADETLLHNLASLIARDRSTTAALLAHLAEVDARKLYLPAAYPSMFTYCVGELRMSEDVAFKRIRAARMARRFPSIYGAIADGRLHLTAVVFLTPHLTEETADELLAAAESKSKVEIEQLLAQRFPQPDLPTQVRALPSRVPSETYGEPSVVQLRQSDQLVPEPVLFSSTQHASQGVPEPATPPPTPAKIKPLAPRRFALQLTMSQRMHDLLRRAQELLGHQIPSGEVADVLELALDGLVTRLEKRKHAATSEPRSGESHQASHGRSIPAHVRRTVWTRDGGQCTFVSDTGRRCKARKLLEFDHVQEFARGGDTSVSGMQLRCRAHNQYTAERTYGLEFMSRKRQQAAAGRGEKAQRAP